MPLLKCCDAYTEAFEGGAVGLKYISYRGFPVGKYKSVGSMFFIEELIPI